jgi:hypothetical protein
LVNKGKKEILAKIHDPDIIFFDFIVKGNHPVVFVKGDIEQPFHDSGFPHFTPGQDGGAHGFLVFDIIDPLEKISQFFFSAGEQFGFADSFF